MVGLQSNIRSALFFNSSLRSQPYYHSSIHPSLACRHSIFSQLLDSTFYIALSLPALFFSLCLFSQIRKLLPAAPSSWPGYNTLFRRSHSSLSFFPLSPYSRVVSGGGGGVTDGPSLRFQGSFVSSVLCCRSSIKRSLTRNSRLLLTTTLSR
jgi:hypothetical protein